MFNLKIEKLWNYFCHISEMKGISGNWMIYSSMTIKNTVTKETIEVSSCMTLCYATLLGTQLSWTGGVPVCLPPIKFYWTRTNMFIFMHASEYRFLLLFFWQFDFLEPRNLTGIVTQGNKDINSWVESYTVQHSLDGKVWNPVLDSASHSEKVIVLYEWLHLI